jgi:plastocyanin
MRKRTTILRMFGVTALYMLISVAAMSADEITLTGHVEVVQAKKKGPQGNSDVVVWLTSVNPASASAEVVPPTQHFRLIQKNKSFEPHVLVVPVGAVVEFPNQDPFFHNVFSLFEGKRFDLGLYEAGATRLVRFDRAGICYIFCNIHPEMSAVVVVLSTPYYAVSDHAGQITIPNVPPGRYILHTWYEGSTAEDMKNLSREITVSEVNRSLGTLRVPEGNTLRLAHKNKYGRDYDNPNPVSPAYQHP